LVHFYASSVREMFLFLHYFRKSPTHYSGIIPVLLATYYSQNYSLKPEHEEMAICTLTSMCMCVRMCAAYMHPVLERKTCTMFHQLSNLAIVVTF